MTVLLSIPSPSSPYIFRLGHLQPRWYGLLLACGVLLGGWIARREFRRRGVDPDIAYPIAVWAVPFGLAGARLYHVATDWGAFWPNHLTDMPKIWQGGLGIWGAVLGGMLGVWIATRRLKLSYWLVADSIAPGLILAQALGRWGNYANQELYGHPSSLPWAIQISPAHRYAPYQAYSTFQPMFLYESIWDAACACCPVWFARRYWNNAMEHRLRALHRPLLHHPATTRNHEDRPRRPRPRTAHQRLGRRRNARYRPRLVWDLLVAPPPPPPSGSGTPSRPHTHPDGQTGGRDRSAPCNAGPETMTQLLEERVDQVPRLIDQLAAMRVVTT